MNQRLKVLIVDDESSQRTGLAAMISAWGMTPETAGEGNEALQKLNDFAADVILMNANVCRWNLERFCHLARNPRHVLR